MAVKMVFQIMIVLLCSIDAILFVQAAGLAINSTSCQAICGDVSIPYPFGIGAGCYVDHWFEVVCNDSFSPPKPFLSSFGLEVLNISLGDAYRSSRSTVRVNYPTFSTRTYNSSSRKQNVELANSSFIFSQEKNIFVAMGCDNSASMGSSDGSIIGCKQSSCDSSKVVINGSSCNGTNCCQTTIASDLNAFETTIDPISDPAVTKQCNSAFLVEEEWFRESCSLINMSSIMSHVPVVLEWWILETSFNTLPIANKTAENTKAYYCDHYRYISASTKYKPSVACFCNWGFEGNPYLLSLFLSL
ncbi:wall-associated receptor kinase-like 6 [Alnus glutinosa]|uniref:wall-associated receptor kinase-like 6 n=1 Tax=Alnus glutinosa TaxID=3517 RepID=UPI002D7A074F|nr:wall-associated receptor kinase-like 6 [Alnus glutinosa]